MATVYFLIDLFGLTFGKDLPVFLCAQTVKWLATIAITRLPLNIAQRRALKVRKDWMVVLYPRYEHLKIYLKKKCVFMFFLSTSIYTDP